MITAQVERYTDCLPELREIYPIHWQELALNQDKVPLNMMWEVYEQHDANGALMLVTLRENGALVGYFIGFVYPGLHYRDCLTLTMDIFFTVPQVRGRTAALRLFRAVEKEAKSRGVQRVFFGSKNHRDSSRLFKALGYTPVETWHSKWIGD